MKWLKIKTLFNDAIRLFKHYLSFNSSNCNTIKEFSCEIVELNEFIKIVKEIKEIAKKYSNKPELLVAQYGRSLKYCGIKWSIICGDLPTKFKNEVEKEYSFFPSIKEFKLPNGDLIDAPHFWAVINGFYNNHGDICGWCGDLTTFASDLQNNSSIKFPSNSFGKQDLITDLDAFNLCKCYNNEIVENMETYFRNVTTKSRVNCFITNKSIEERYNNSADSLYLDVLKETYKVSSISDAAKRMETHLDNNK